MLNIIKKLFFIRLRRRLWPVSVVECGEDVRLRQDFGEISPKFQRRRTSADSATNKQRYNILADNSAKPPNENFEAKQGNKGKYHGLCLRGFIFFVVILLSISRNYGLAQEELFDLEEKVEDINEEIEYLDEELENMDIMFNEQLTAIIDEAKEGLEVVDENNSFIESSEPNKISLDIKGMDIVDVLKLLANQGNLNIVTGKNVTGRVSMFLKDVDVWDAFEIIVAANGLAYEKKGDIIKVMSERDYETIYGEKYDDRKIFVTRKLKYANAKDISTALNQIKSALGKVVVDESSNTLILLDMPERIEEMAEIIEATDISYDLETKVFELSYAESDKLKDQLQEVLTKNVGVLKTDERTNKIVAIDYPYKIAQMQEIVKAFDEKTKQVLIEAKIIKVTLTDTYKMGIDWKFIASKQLNLTAFNISRSLNTSGAQVVGGVEVPTSTNDFRVIMDILKTFGDVSTLSTPRITATDGQEAKILVGSKEVYVSSSTVSTDATTTTSEEVNFVDVGVKLYVTPTINKDGFITMKIRPEVSSANRTFTKQDGTFIPIVETTEAETSVLVKDGVTIVMGGLMKDERTKNIYKLPLLGEIPFLGAFFRRTEDTVTKTELVIFLTPHIISGAESMLGTDTGNALKNEQRIEKHKLN